MNQNHTCPKCKARLNHVMVRELRAVEVQRVHANAGRFLESVATHEVIGECPLHGMVRKNLFSVPELAAQ